MRFQGSLRLLLAFLLPLPACVSGCFFGTWESTSDSETTEEGREGNPRNLAHNGTSERRADERRNNTAALAYFYAREADTTSCACGLPI